MNKPYEQSLKIETASDGGFVQRLRSLCAYEIGVIPLPIFLGIAVIVYLSAHLGFLPKNMIGGLAVIMTMGVFFGQMGSRLPILKEIGGGAILCLMLPSILVFYGFFGPATIDATKMLMKEANFLYFVIASLVVGSILGMSRFILVQGMLRMFIPLLVGTLAAVASGLIVGKLVGYSFHHTFFFIIVPIIGGGIGEGILPLSLAYSAILGGTPDIYVAQLAPAAVVGNIVAIICAGYLARLALKRPTINGEGSLIRAKDENDQFLVKEDTGTIVDFRVMGAGVLVICAFFVLGGLLEKVVGIPGPVMMILAAVLFKYLRVLPEKLEKGANSFYKLVSSAFIWPVMIGLGMLYVPLDSVVKVFSVGYVLVCVSVVVSMTVAGFFIGNLMKMYPIESAIVTCCHSGLGGTGDVAILSASNRMSLMPFAQISTRIGGASTVILATILLRLFV
ncbi:Citrate/malate transporter [compost metagenome]|jgi:malate:Na+ symporter|uniref:Citrate/malate transporter n=2 Tax=Pseudomonas TaxID=286 RepID=A0A5E7R7Z2_PSEFL|nr:MULTISPECIES: 2-hydroxycarboxylate transporter family protein [Pseudomonas]MBV7492302.1 2-hydroxycarboxylate transporter family protein [Pseudomonas sp. PDM30]OOQ45031.1 malate permease [Pseudomonas fluorescens]OXR30068.1 malate permease [Pseudomonas jessenii]QHF38951.1 malate permease [Pseudomonas sp. S34]SEC23145.1 malate:Na+ symporter [Pseudomonas jessenii]